MNEEMRERESNFLFLSSTALIKYPALVFCKPGIWIFNTKISVQGFPLMDASFRPHKDKNYIYLEARVRKPI